MFVWEFIFLSWCFTQFWWMIAYSDITVERID